VTPLASSIDHLELIRDAPERAIAAKTSRVRRGNLVGGPDSPIIAFEEGVTDFASRWTLSHQELQRLPPAEEGHRVGLIERFARGLADAAATPRDLLYIDGEVFVKDADGRFVTRKRPSADAPRHPNDPASLLGVLYGVVAPVDLVQSKEDNGVQVHLSAVAELSVADRISPHGVRPGGCESRFGS
jgi:hypothetical protein